MSKIKWHTGAPPSIGWWPASMDGDKNEIRWWDGELWSFAAYPCHDAAFAKCVAMDKNSSFSHAFKWSERWWI